MNFIKNIRLKYKPLIVFAVLALINAGGIYILRQYVVNEMVDHVLPTQQVVGEFGYTTKLLQVEALEYVNSGEEEAREQFAVAAAQLPLLSERLAGLAHNENELQIYAANEATSLNMATVGQELIDQHGETLALLETFEEAELAKDVALDNIDRTVLAGESDLAAVLLTQSLSQIERIQTETLEYVLTGEDEAVATLNEERSLFFINLQALQNVLATDQTSLGVRVRTILDASTEIAQLSEEIAASHGETLAFLEELEELEGWAAETRTELLNQLELDTEALLQTANRTAWIVGLVVQVIALALGFVLARTVVTPILRLSEAAEKLGQGEYSTRVKVTSSDELGELMANFNEMAETLGQSVVNARQQAQAISASSEVSRRLSTILDTSELTTAVVELLQFTFKYYHAHIYLYDDARKYLVMAGGTGEAGRTMLESNHKIESGKGLVGRTAEENKPTLVPDVSADADWLPNPLLPDTKAEVAVPITLENEVLGVLDIQHNVAGGLDQSDVALLTSIANQVAIGLQNALQYQQLQASEAQIKTILDTINVPITITRVSDGSFIYFNGPSLEATNVDPNNIGEDWKADIFYDDASPSRQKFVANLREHGKVENLEITLKKITGEPFRVLMSAHVIDFQGERAVMTSYIDIEEHRKTREASLRHAKEMETVADVGTVTATILEPDRLLKETVNLIKSRFSLYHAHIHLLNDSKDTLVLTAGAGEVGQKMVAEGRRIPLAAEGSLVATVARTKQGNIRNYDPPGEGFMPHPLLAETRCEMAVPISVGNEVLGVLDVRSDQLHYFTDADMQTYTIMAAQIAVALQNAWSYARSEEALRELQELSRRLTREGWDEFFGQQLQALAYRYDLEQVSPVAESDEEAESDTETALTQSLQVQGESIGELLLGSAKLNADEATEIVAAVAERLSAHLENLRLAQQTQSALNETQRRTEELAILNEMSQALTAQTTVDGVFHTVYNYLSRLMDTTDFYTVIYDEENDEVEFVLTASGDKQRWHTERRQAGTGITEYLIRQRQSLLIPENVEQHLADLGIEGYGKMPESWLGVPIILGDRVLGVIGVESYTTPHLYNEQHLNLLTAVANQAAIAIESTRLLEGTVALAEEEQILRQITTRVSTAVDAETILRTAAEEIGRALGLEGYVSLEGVNSNGNGTNGHDLAVKSHDKANAN